MNDYRDLSLIYLPILEVWDLSSSLQDLDNCTFFLQLFDHMKKKRVNFNTKWKTVLQTKDL